MKCDSRSEGWLKGSMLLLMPKSTVATKDECEAEKSDMVKQMNASAEMTTMELSQKQGGY